VLALALTPPRTVRALYGLEPPSRLAAGHTALVLVDFQEEFFHGRLPLPRGPAAAANAVRLAGWARAHGVVVVHVRNVVDRPGTPLFAPRAPATAIIAALAPRHDELVITKAVGGGFSRTDLDGRLRARGIDTVIVAGLMTHLAVTITAADATVLGYHTVVAADATATRDLPGAGGEDAVAEAVLQRAALAALADRAAAVMVTDHLLRLPVDP
jgi:nicotinamidase-related amidase